MPTITVEDGTIVANANSYVSVADADAYFTSMNDTDWSATTVTTTHKQVALLRAMPYLEELSWKGTTVSGVDQSLQWPRQDVYDRDNTLLEEDYVPNGIKLAQYEAAIRVLDDREILQPDEYRGGKIISSSIVGSIATVYKRSAPSGTVFTIIKGYIKGLIKSDNSIAIRRA
jgi:hypothetical protein